MGENEQDTRPTPERTIDLGRGTLAEVYEGGGLVLHNRSAVRRVVVEAEETAALRELIEELQETAPQGEG